MERGREVTFPCLEECGTGPTACVLDWNGDMYTQSLKFSLNVRYVIYSWGIVVIDIVPKL